MRKRLWSTIGLGACLVLAAAVPSGAAVVAPRTDAPMTAPANANVGRPHCQPADRPETDLQGRVPPADRPSGRAVLGYTCNLKLVGGFQSASFANFDSYKNCVYYTDNRGGAWHHMRGSSKKRRAR